MFKGIPVNRNHAPLRLLPLVENTPGESGHGPDGGSAPSASAVRATPPNRTAQHQGRCEGQTRHRSLRT